jgi:hypothetical protein
MKPLPIPPSVWELCPMTRSGIHADAKWWLSKAISESEKTKIRCQPIEKEVAAALIAAFDAGE